LIHFYKRNCDNLAPWSRVSRTSEQEYFVIVKLD
jgi:hypothetical protein